MDNNELDFKIQELSFKGYTCSQIIILLGQYLNETNNKILIRAMAGLANGLYIKKCGICGTLLGSFCLASIYLGKGNDNEENNTNLYLIISEITQWFKSEFKNIECYLLLNKINKKEVICKEIIKKTFIKLIELLNKYDIDPFNIKEE